MDFRWFHFEKVAAITHRNFFAGKMTASINWRVGLGDKIIFLAITGEILNLVGDPPIMNLTVGRLDETKLVDASESRHRTDETDVRALRRLDRANTTVMRGMNVAYFESGSI